MYQSNVYWVINVHNEFWSKIVPMCPRSKTFLDLWLFFCFLLAFQISICSTQNGVRRANSLRLGEKSGRLEPRLVPLRLWLCTPWTDELSVQTLIFCGTETRWNATVFSEASNCTREWAWSLLSSLWEDMCSCWYHANEGDAYLQFSGEILRTQKNRRQVWVVVETSRHEYGFSVENDNVYARELLEEQDDDDCCTGHQCFSLFEAGQNHIWLLHLKGTHRKQYSSKNSCLPMQCLILKCHGILESLCSFERFFGTTTRTHNYSRPWCAPNPPHNYLFGMACSDDVQSPQK